MQPIRNNSPNFEAVTEGIDNLTLESDKEEIIPVAARVHDLALWKCFPGVQHISEIQIDNGLWLVTGRIPVSKVDELRKQNFIFSSNLSGHRFPISSGVNYCA